MMNERYELLRGRVENYLESAFTVDNSEYYELYDAMKYSVLGGGKRLRGVLMLECGRICGIDEEEMLPFAAAIEMIHASTLIHDDLPCMDDDDFRRGKPSCHKQFGEDVALLAGDALYAFAIHFLIKRVQRFNYPGSVLSALTVFTGLCGADGVFAGQILDKRFEKEVCSFEQLLQLHGLKTGALFSACVRIPCILSLADSETEKALRIYISNLGLAFQVKDDILDVEGSFEHLGKLTGADDNKSTFIHLMGLEDSRKYLNSLVSRSESAISIIKENDLLLWICNFVANRNN